MSELRKYSTDDCDIILFTACDLHGVARGRFVFRDGLKSILKNGLGITQAGLCTSILCDIPHVLTDYKDQGWSNGSLVPDTATLAPLSWISNNKFKVGQLLCGLYDTQDKRDMCCTRGLLQKQMERLESLGFQLRASSFLEVSLYRNGALAPLENLTELMSTLLREAEASSLPVLTIGQGVEPGKLQIFLSSQPLLSSADSTFRLRYTIRSICKSQGYEVTFMTKPSNESSSNSCFFTYSLHSKDGRNMFSDEQQPNQLSELGHHWLAGTLCHSDAMSALLRPTLNCYSRDKGRHDIVAAWAVHGQEDKSRLVVTSGSGGVTITDRLATSAVNPYLALTAIVAAGIDGITKQLDCPAQNEPRPMPTSLAASLEAMSKSELKDVIGSNLFDNYSMLKNEFEIKRFNNNQDKQNLDPHSLDFDLSLYFSSL